MKKITKTAALAAAAACSLSAVSAADGIRVLLDGNELEFDVPPQIIDERTMVPLRVIFEAMGAKVDWNGEMRTVTASTADTTVKMTVDNTEMYINGAAVTLDVPPQIVDDRTLVPARAVAESFGAEVDWDGETDTVIITSAAKETPAPAEKPSAEPTEEPTEEPADSGIRIEADVKTTASVNNFAVNSVADNGDGTYTLDFKFFTFLEGHGTVTAVFNCLDASGKVIDTFGGTYPTTDYTWSLQEDTAVIPSETVKITLSE